MIQAFYTGISGIKSHQSAIDVTSDNLANINTVGFRSFETEFASLFEAPEETTFDSSVDSSVGIGSRMQTTALNLSQGSLIDSDRNSDLAIVGDGWFGIEDANERYYTRAGNFGFDSNRDLVTPEGMYVLGTLGDNIDLTNNTLTQELTDIPLGDVTAQKKIQLPKTLTYPAQPTKSIQFFGNIGTDDEVRIISAKAIDANGESNKVKLTFTLNQKDPNGGSLWDVKADVTTPDESKVYSSSTGEVRFDSSGGLVSSTLTSVDNNGTPVSIDLGSDFSGVISIGNVPVSGSSQSDGISSGELVGYDINQNGEVVATFSNGRQSSVAQIALFHFQNDQGLERISGTLFQSSPNSGKPTFFQDANKNNVLGASIVNQKLEASNFKIETGLTELIIYQRAYDANAKSVTTADQMIQKALNMDA
ncbi:Flagellar hook protein FlgE [hydrothermal vent metagenome]|uniref:Flagellar hook protein FlgE n=1 Tax=hydrothermal vent metagenome TaxID=652676 RepID=A0A1W1BVX7_9ZZZZ